MAEKVCVLTLVQKRDSVIAVARDIGVPREVFLQLKKSAALLPPAMKPTEAHQWQSALLVVGLPNHS